MALRINRNTPKYNVRNGLALTSFIRYHISPKKVNTQNNFFTFLRKIKVKVIIRRAPRPCGACPTQPFNAVKMLKSK